MNFFYCRSYCLLNMFPAPLCPSSRAREYYTSGCCLSYLVLGFQVVSMVWSWGLCVRFAARKPDTQPLYNTLELPMMGIMVPKTRWAKNKICNKNSSVASSWHLFPHIIDDARSKPHQINLLPYNCNVNNNMMKSLISLTRHLLDVTLTACLRKVFHRFSV
jgi:hypothetical protein